MRALIFIICSQILLHAAQPGYVGSDACAKCHREIAAQQFHSNMALTWQGILAQAEETSEGPIQYRVNGREYSVAMPGHEPVNADVQAVVGGKRHGLSFLARLSGFDGAKLGRPALIEGRYLHRSAGGLALSPGMAAGQPSSFETAIGRVLSPSFEKKCLTCHGAPQYAPAGKSGVQCEDCHGPGQLHADDSGAKALPKPTMETCSRCHSGFSELVDPLPDDLLISNQVTALRNSECSIQTAGGLTCTNCHNPHSDSSSDEASLKTCLGCHGVGLQKAAQCPVNAKADCVRCHMPTVVREGTYPLVDHWIRVHDKGSGLPTAAASAAAPATPLRRIFAKLIVVRSPEEAIAIHDQLTKGGSFFDLAREHSLDPSAPSGGFLGEQWIDQMDPALAAVATKLRPGEISEVLPSRGNFLIFQRMPRDFRWQAAALAREAERLKAKGALNQAIQKYQEALQTNPGFLHALVLLGAAFGESGDKRRAVAALEQATLLFPKDPSAFYNLGIAYGQAGLPVREIESYRRAIELEPDLVPAYMNLGAALLSAGQVESAIDVFRKGLDVNPLAATLYYNLGLAWQGQNKLEEARGAFETAGKIDPRLRIPATLP